MASFEDSFQKESEELALKNEELNTLEAKLKYDEEFVQYFTMSKSTPLPDVSEMNTSELKEELRSYGTNIASILEESELIAAVELARVEGKTPKTTSDGKEDSYNEVFSASDITNLYLHGEIITVKKSLFKNSAFAKQ